MITAPWKLVSFDPKATSDADWEPILDLNQAASLENNPNDPMPPREGIRQNMTQMSDHPMIDIWINLVYNVDDNRLAGFLFGGFQKPGTPEYEDNKHVAFADMYVAQDYRRQGLGSRLLGVLAQECAERGVTLLQGGASTSNGNAFCEHYDFIVAGRARENRLAMSDIDWALVEAWAKTPAQANGAEIVTFEGLFEEDLEGYCKVYTELFSDVPTDDMEGTHQIYTPERMRQFLKMHEERNRVWTTKMVREANGEISGVTEIIYDPDRPHRVSQLLTGVKKSERGRGLGKWLKTDMILFIRENYPDIDFISTGNANSNAPMLSINERLGFKPYKDQTMYKVKISDVQERLATESAGESS